MEHRCRCLTMRSAQRKWRLQMTLWKGETLFSKGASVSWKKQANLVLASPSERPSPSAKSRSPRRKRQKLQLCNSGRCQRRLKMSWSLSKRRTRCLLACAGIKAAILSADLPLTSNQLSKNSNRQKLLLKLRRKLSNAVSASSLSVANLPPRLRLSTLSKTKLIKSKVSWMSRLMKRLETRLLSLWIPGSLHTQMGSKTLLEKTRRSLTKKNFKGWENLRTSRSSTDRLTASSENCRKRLSTLNKPLITRSRSWSTHLKNGTVTLLKKATNPPPTNSLCSKAHQDKLVNKQDLVSATTK